MLKKIAIAVVVLIAAVLIYAATRPDQFQVERAAAIAAPPERVFALINDLHAWSAWSPWEHLDPAMKKTLSGADSGKGAVYEWRGNKAVGQGRMEITDSVPPSQVVIKLDFIEPFAAHNVTVFSLEPQGAMTRVRWTMQGASPYLSKLMGVFVDMDKMIGKDFETGLANLKLAAEK
jgi:uncharacterized protein YndB with AHSA1/START domain